jgi:two-component system LytT family sensor kinase
VTSEQRIGSRLRIAGGWSLVVVLFASQWYIYDAVHHNAERATYYLITSVYLWGVLTPAVLWMASRCPIHSRTWSRAVPLHIAASVALSAVGVFVEATVAWMPHAQRRAFPDLLRHYFTQHTEISVLTYWALLSGVHVYRMYDRARRRELQAMQLEAQLAEAQLAALRTQLQPHFLFNTLQAATTLLYDDPAGAEEVLLSLSELLRRSLRALETQEAPFYDEIEFLRHYAAIQQRRFGDRLQFHFEIEEEAEACALPGLMLQPIVENAVTHGIGKHKEPDVITVRARVENGLLQLDVSNLTSVLDDAPAELLARGTGLANTAGRLRALYGFEHSLVIRNLAPRGVAVSISIPRRSMAKAKAILPVGIAP